MELMELTFSVWNFKIFPRFKDAQVKFFWFLWRCFLHFLGEVFGHSVCEGGVWCRAAKRHSWVHTRPREPRPSSQTHRAILPPFQLCVRWPDFHLSLSAPMFWKKEPPHECCCRFSSILWENMLLSRHYALYWVAIFWPQRSALAKVEVCRWLRSMARAWNPSCGWLCAYSGGKAIIHGQTLPAHRQADKQAGRPTERGRPPRRMRQMWHPICILPAARPTGLAIWLVAWNNEAETKNVSCERMRREKKK